MTVVLDHTFLGGNPWIELVRAVRNCTAKSPWVWEWCSGCPAGPAAAAATWRYRNGMWPRYYSPAQTPGQSSYKFPTESSVLHLCLLLCEFCTGAGQVMDWVSVFSPWTHVHKLEQVSLSAGSVLPCPEFLFPWDLRCNGNTATAGNRPQASHQCHKAKGFFWLWLNSWLAWSLLQQFLLSFYFAYLLKSDAYVRWL